MSDDRMKLIHRRDIIRKLRERWSRQYAYFDESDKIGTGSNRRTIATIRADLNKINLETCSLEEINEVLPGWAANKCDVCNRDFETLIQIGDDPDYDANWQTLCLDCLDRARTMLCEATPKT